MKGPPLALLAATLLLLAPLAGCLERAPSTAAVPSGPMPQEDTRPYEARFTPPRLCDDPPPQDAWETPPCIREVAEAFVAHMLGEERLRDNITFTGTTYWSPSPPCDPEHQQPCESWRRAPVYFVSFGYRTGKMGNNTSGISFGLATNGTVVLDLEIKGLAPCRWVPSECVFIDRDEALRIAREAGLGKGIRPWTSYLGWYGKPSAREWEPPRNGTFTWTVHSDYTEWNGESAYIDANSGEVLGFGKSTTYSH